MIDNWHYWYDSINTVLANCVVFSNHCAMPTNQCVCFAMWLRRQSKPVYW